MTAAYPPAPPTGGDEHEHQPIGELIGEITQDLSRLFRQEVELAKAEMKVEAKKAGKGAGMLGAAAVAGLMVIILLSFAVVYALDAVMPQGWAAVIVAVLWAIVGAVLFMAGRKQMSTVNPVPQQTTETMKENAEWLRNPTG
ncbi:MAG TPA: phage holin family protein [Catenuloplanes sp.]|jgi:protein-S-isoprenylcysteine O-methyltransferase Ste14